MQRLFDGASETSRAVLRKSLPQQSSKRPLQTTSSASWSSCGNEYGGWVKGDPALESKHNRDLMMARNFAKFGAVDPSLKQASQTRLAVSGDVGMQARSTTPVEAAVTVQSDHRVWGSPQLRSAKDAVPAERLQDFPGMPGSSLGLRCGSRQQWSFERTPSLLHGPLERDCGRQGRSCQGLPPAAALQQALTDSEASSTVRSNGGFGWHSGEISPTSLRPTATGTLGMSPGMQRCRSGPSALGAKGKVSGLQGVIGVTWDDAATTAGGGKRGSDGRFLGF